MASLQARVKDNRGSPVIQELAGLNEATYSHPQLVEDE